MYELYEKIADWFDVHRSRTLFEKPYLDMAIAYLKSNAKILDLGCGMGEPIAKYFADKGYQLTGIDGSKKMINMAKVRVPNATFLVGDMRECMLGEKFDCILAWHSLFHLTQDDQRAMFKIFEKHISSGGILMFTSGPDAGEVWGDNGGQNLYHASLSASEYKNLLAAHHFEVITHIIEDPNCGDATVWVARYRLNEERIKIMNASQLIKFFQKRADASEALLKMYWMYTLSWVIGFVPISYLFNMSWGFMWSMYSNTTVIWVLIYSLSLFMISVVRFITFEPSK